MRVLRSTLVGIATGTPDGGVAIVRISGPEAGSLATSLMGPLPPPRVLSLRTSNAGAQALVVFMPGPTSYTGEDVVELHLHANVLELESVVQSLLKAGATAAGPGDFTRRAYDLGRIGLDRAEGIAALIGARTEAALSQARRLVAGELGSSVRHTRESLLRLRTEIEADLDFPEDVGGDLTAHRSRALLELRGTLKQFVDEFDRSRRAREGARVVLCGPANAGKSALFNALLGHQRALVAEMPGTTRDYLEAELKLGACSVVLVDTAGLRTHSSDPLEHSGMSLTRRESERADLCVWIEAADTSDAEIPEWIPGGLRVESKRDLGGRRSGWIGVCALHADVGELRAALESWIGQIDGAWIGLARHRECAAAADSALTEAQRFLEEGIGLELVAFALTSAERCLAEMTGDPTFGPIGAPVLDAIFSRFCIGK